MCVYAVEQQMNQCKSALNNMNGGRGQLPAILLVPWHPHPIQHWSQQGWEDIQRPTTGSKPDGGITQRYVVDSQPVMYNNTSESLEVTMWHHLFFAHCGFIFKILWVTDHYSRSDRLILITTSQCQDSFIT
jgi:hypothetical protein